MITYDEETAPTSGFTDPGLNLIHRLYVATQPVPLANDLREQMAEAEDESTDIDRELLLEALRSGELRKVWFLVEDIAERSVREELIDGEDFQTAIYMAEADLWKLVDLFEREPNLWDRPEALVRNAVVRQMRQERSLRSAKKQYDRNRARIEADRAIAKSRSVCPNRPSTTMVRGRAPRSSSATRSRGSSRSGASARGGGGSDDSDPSDSDGAQGAGTLDDRHGHDVKRCLGCGEPIDPSRRSDAKVCDSTCQSRKKANEKAGVEATPLPTAEQRLAEHKRLPLKEFEPSKSGNAYGVSLCREGWKEGKDKDKDEPLISLHPPDPDVVGAKVSAYLRSGDRSAAAKEVRSFLSKCSHDRADGDLTCRNCGRWVCDYVALIEWVRIGDEEVNLRAEMATDSDGIPVHRRAVKVPSKDSPYITSEYNPDAVGDEFRISETVEVVA